MRGPAPLRVFLAPPVRAELRGLSSSTAVEHRMVVRARIILFAASGEDTPTIAARVGCSERTVRKWRSRFRESPCVESLYDLPRSGRPPEIPVKVRCELIKLACSRPGDSRAPFREV